jgi:diguanylate cyclase (GGDEF)-like protein
MTHYALFEKEQSVVDHISLVLQDECMNAETARGHLSSLLVQYKKLLRQTQQLVKLGDSHASKLYHVNDQLKQYSESLEYSASHDALTDLFNKGTITDIIRKRLGISDFVLILLDIDHFKKVNDTFGHHVGDQVLNGLAQLMKNNIKHKDYLGRFGGEEFIMVLNDTKLSQCLGMASKLLKKIEGTVLVNDGEMRVSVTVSMGLTSVNKYEAFVDVYTRADRLLYAAKHKGRNRIESDLS